MISPEEFTKSLIKNSFNFFTGVPDSTFKSFMSYINTLNNVQHILATNEGEACAIATGYHLASGKTPIIYMQNSGLGNAVNPLTSLMDDRVYAIPALLFIGWRGEPGKKDEPQHARMGPATIPLLVSIGVEYTILPKDFPDALREIKKAKQYIKTYNKPFAVIIRKGTFEPFSVDEPESALMFREEAIKTIIDSLSGAEAVISTTGKTSRELFECRIARRETLDDFYTVGSMGFCSAIALGIAKENKNQATVVLDGDGSVLMHMGSLATIGHYHPENLYHFVLDNNSYESTGGQPTTSKTVDLKKIALACGYKGAETITTQDRLIEAIKGIRVKSGPRLFVIKIRKGARSNLGRPTTNPADNKKAFMQKIK